MSRVRAWTLAGVLDRLQAWGTKPVVNPKRVRPGAPQSQESWSEGFTPVRRRDTFTTGLIVLLVVIVIAATQWFWLHGANAPFIYSEF